MAAVTLDRTRPYGSITGDLLGRAFEQDHQYFNADGSLWVAPPEPPEILPTEPEPEPAKPAARKGKA